MPDKVNASKVVCYIVRDGQLLVFRHADYDLEQVGLQSRPEVSGLENPPKTPLCAKRARKPASASSAWCAS